MRLFALRRPIRTPGPIKTKTNITMRSRTRDRGSGYRMGITTAGADSATYTQRKLSFFHPIVSTMAQELPREITTRARKAAATSPTAKTYGA